MQCCDCLIRSTGFWHKCDAIDFYLPNCDSAVFLKLSAAIWLLARSLPRLSVRDANVTTEIIWLHWWWWQFTSYRSFFCNWWVAGLSPAPSVSVVVSLDKKLHPPRLLMVVRGRRYTAALPLSVWLVKGSSVHNVAYHHLCVNGWIQGFPQCIISLGGHQA